MTGPDRRGAGGRNDPFLRLETKPKAFMNPAPHLDAEAGRQAENGFWVLSPKRTVSPGACRPTPTWGAVLSPRPAEGRDHHSPSLQPGRGADVSGAVRDPGPAWLAGEEKAV